MSKIKRKKFDPLVGKGFGLIHDGVPMDGTTPAIYLPVSDVVNLIRMTSGLSFESNTYVRISISGATNSDIVPENFVFIPQATVNNIQALNGNFSWLTSDWYTVITPPGDTGTPASNEVWLEIPDSPGALADVDDLSSDIQAAFELPDSVRGNVNMIAQPETLPNFNDLSLITEGRLQSQLGANNELSEVLVNGNVTGGKDIVLTSGDALSSEGDGILNPKVTLKIIKDPLGSGITPINIGTVSEDGFYVGKESINQGVSIKDNQAIIYLSNTRYFELDLNTNFNVSFDNSPTANRTYTLPDASGTIALLSDVDDQVATNVNNVAWVHSLANNAEAKIGNPFKPFASISQAVDVLPTDSVIYLISDSGGDSIITKNITIIGMGQRLTDVSSQITVGSSNQVEIINCDLQNILVQNAGTITLRNSNCTNISRGTGGGSAYLYSSNISGGALDVVVAKDTTFQGSCTTRQGSTNCVLDNCLFKSTLRLRDRSGGTVRNSTLVTGVNNPIDWDNGFSGFPIGVWNLYDIVIHTSATYAINEFAAGSSPQQMVIMGLLYNSSSLANLNFNTITFQSDVVKMSNGVTEHQNSLQANSTARYTSTPALANPLDFATVDYVDNAVVGALVYKGAYDASAVAPNGSALIGWTYTVTVAGTGGGYFSENLEVGDVIIAEIDNPASETDWTVVNRNIDSATETVAGIAEIATQAETDAGVDDTRFVTPAKLAAYPRTLNDVVEDGGTTNQDIEITDSTKGIILTAPNASRWRVTVDNSGNLITTSI